MTARVLEVASHNMTEGIPTDQVLNADIVLGQEIARRRFAPAMRRSGKRVYIPLRDRHQGVAWDPAVLTVPTREDRGYVRFHRSGRAERWDFPSPARGMTWCESHITGALELPIAFADLWLLNSWFPIHPDHHTAARRRVVEELCLPVIRRKVARWHQLGFRVILGGDVNSLPWDGVIDDMTQVDRGLDRLWFTTPGRDRPGFEIRATWEGPKTGVGTDARHNSIHARAALVAGTRR